MEEIRTITIALGEFFEEHALPDDALFPIELSLEEIFTNVAIYAHDDNQEHEVEIIFTREDETIIVEILDDGYPFNPLKDAPELDTKSSLRDRRIGGAGIMIAKQLMTELRYERNNARNHLTMIKKI